MHKQLSPERQRATLAKVSWRLLPLIVASYLVAYIDRTNVSFAALTMNEDIGLSAYMFGWGAGIFFISYALFEVPSNIDPAANQRSAVDRAHHDHLGHRLRLDGHRSGARRVFSFCAFCSAWPKPVSSPGSSSISRTGFHPRIALARSRCCISPCRSSNAVASILSGAILGMDGILGVKGWQWVFIIEAIPAVLLAFVVLKVMTDRPAHGNLARARSARVARRPAAGRTGKDRDRRSSYDICRRSRMRASMLWRRST